MTLQTYVNINITTPRNTSILSYTRKNIVFYSRVKNIVVYEHGAGDGQCGVAL